MRNAKTDLGDYQCLFVKCFSIYTSQN